MENFISCAVFVTEQLHAPTQYSRTLKIFFQNVELNWLYM